MSRIYGLRANTRAGLGGTKLGSLTSTGLGGLKRIGDGESSLNRGSQGSSVCKGFNSNLIVTRVPST